MNDETQTRDARFAAPTAPVDLQEPHAGASTGAWILAVLVAVQSIWVASALGKFFTLASNGSMSAIALLELLIGWSSLAWGAICLVRRLRSALTPFVFASLGWLAFSESMLGFVAHDPLRWLRLESYFVPSMLLAVAGVVIAFRRRRAGA
jgi:hypothetical protein